MPQRYNISFYSLSDSDAPLTKFGGQPSWIGEPKWPLSKELGTPMRFICQIELPVDIFPSGQGKVAYIFMTDDEEYVDGTWEAYGGENAVIIQDGGVCDVNIQPLESGLTLQNYVEVQGSDRLQPVDVEYGVNLVKSEDPNFISKGDLFDRPEEYQEKYGSSIEGNKIGGTPGFLQGDEFPNEDQNWKLLLQLESCDQPFTINFGDAGIGYIFVTDDCNEGRFLWQCC